MFEWRRFIPDPIQPPPEQPTAKQVADEQPVPAHPTAYPMLYVPGVASTFAMRRTVSGTERRSPPPAARTPITPKVEQLTQQLAQWQTKFEEQEEMVRLLTEALSAKNNSQTAPSSKNLFLQPQHFNLLPALKE